MPTGVLNRFFSTSGTGAKSVSGTADRVAIFDADGELAASVVLSSDLILFESRLDAIEALPDGSIYIGDGAGVISEVVPSGDVTISNLGVTAIEAGVIVDADVNASAAITRSKTASGTASVVLTNDGSGVMSESTILDTELDHLNDAVGETTVALADNQAAAADVFVYANTFEYSVVEYGIARGAGNRETGRLMIASDGTLVNMSQDTSILGAIGVTLTADTNGGNIRVRYTSTSTGVAPTFKYTQRRWGV